MTDTMATAAEVEYRLYIGARSGRPSTPSTSPTRASPAGSSGARHPRRAQDVADAVAAAKAAFPAWSALSRAGARRQMRAALEGIAEARDDDAAILSQENGKIRFESLDRRARLRDPLEPRAHARRRGRHRKVLPVVPGIPVETTVSYQPLGVVTLIVPFNWPIAILGARPSARAAGRQHRDRQAAALDAAGHDPGRAAHRREAARRRAERGHRQGREHVGPDPEHRRREGLLHRHRSTAASASWRWPRRRSPASRSSWAATTRRSSSKTRSSTTRTSTASTPPCSTRPARSA